MHLVDHGRQVLVAGRRALGDQPDDLVVHLRVQGRERQVLELPLDRVHTEPVRQRGVDLQRLAGDPLLLLLAQRSRACACCAAGRTSLITSTRMSLDIATTILRIVSACADSPYCTLSSLVTPSTSMAISSPKSRVRSSTVYGVSSTVSCSSAAQSVGRGHTELGEDGGDRERMRDVRVAALAHLAGVVLLRGPVGALDHARDRPSGGSRGPPGTAARASAPGSGAGCRRGGRAGRGPGPARSAAAGTQAAATTGAGRTGDGARGGSCGTASGTADVIAGSSPTLCPSADRAPV